MRRYYSRFPDVFCKREIFTGKFEQIDSNNIGPSAQHFDKVAVGLKNMSQRSNRCGRNLALKENQLATIAEIAKSLGITKNRLLKVVHQLGVAGYVKTVRGRGGGLRLAKPVEAIGLGEVVHYTEPLYSTRHRKCKESNGLMGSFEDRSWARKAII
jgi:Rrf2 family protein